MTQTYFPARPRAQEDMPDERQHRREIARQLNGARGGQLDCTLSVTLDPNEDTTTVIDSRISLSTAPLLVPVTASAAAEIAAGGLYVTPTSGQCVITHANSVVADRTYQLALIG